MSLHHYRTGSRRNNFDQSDQSGQNHRQDCRTSPADAAIYDGSSRGNNERETYWQESHAGSVPAGRPVTESNTDSEVEDRAKQGQHFPATHTGKLDPLDTQHTEWNHTPPHPSTKTVLPSFSSGFGGVSQFSYPPTPNLGVENTFQQVDHSKSFQYSSDRQNYPPPAPNALQNIHYRENMLSNTLQLPPVRALNHSEPIFFSSVESRRESRAPSSDLANKRKHQEIGMQRQDPVNYDSYTIETQHFQHSFQELLPFMQPNIKYRLPAEYDNSQVPVLASRYPEHAQPSEDGIYQGGQALSELGAKCLLPNCLMQVHVKAPFGACNIHSKQLSDWDFHYCEAEMRTCDQGKSDSFFPNGQCIHQKISSVTKYCEHHKSKSKQRKIFKASEIGKDGKWFPGRHEGTAQFPARYGTSGMPSHEERKSTNLDFNRRSADSR